MKSPTHAAALEYAEQRGWFVFPLVPGGKFPLPGTQGHLDATRDPAQIDAWWRSNPNYNVGIAVAPSGLNVLDVDVGLKKDGTPKRGRESLAEINHELTPTLLAETGRGGLHIVYSQPPGLAPHRVIGFKDGLDLIGEGYIVAAPSFNSETGRHYMWTQQIPIAPLPSYLQHVASTPKVKEVVATTGTAIVEGNRNNALYKLGAALRDTGIGREALARALDAENRSRFSPPLPDHEVVQIIDSVMTRVEVKRDVAAGTIVQEMILDIFGTPAQPPPEQWLEDVSLVPQAPVVFYSTGFQTLDALLGGGFATRQLCGLIAPPSTGKSALIGHWLLLLAQHRPVLHCSLELLKHELFVRYAAHRMKVPWRDGIRGAIPQPDMARAVKGLRIKLMGADDFDRLDPFASLRAAVVRMQTENNGVAPVVAIDYIQLMARGAAAEMRFKVGELTFAARQMAQEFDTVVLGVFTTQRSSYNTTAVEKMRAAADPTAYLGAAKESGDIEFDCATLTYLDVDKLHEGPTKPAQLAVARCRQGDVGFVGLRAALDIGSFVEDPSAIAEFVSDTRRAKKEAEKEANLRTILFDVVRTMPGASWGDMQRMAAKRSGIGRGGPVDDMRDALVAEGIIAKSERYDEDHRKAKGDTYIILKGIDKLTPTSSQEEEES